MILGGEIMICQECNEQIASLHFTKIINGKKQEIHICDKCAKQKGDFFSTNNQDVFSFNDLLASFMNGAVTAKGINATSHSSELKCSKCGCSYATFMKVGKLGCGECYEVFGTHLTPILKRVHSGNIEHIGKVPKRIGGTISIKNQIKELKQELQHVILQQEFERAAMIRDQIGSLQKGLETHWEGEY